MEATANVRAVRGLALAKTKGARVKEIVGTKILVPSASHGGGYVVDLVEGSCTCPDWAGFGGEHRCKHMWAALYVRREIPLPDGSSLVTEEEVRIYPRDWRATNRALVDLPRVGPLLIADLVRGIPLPNTSGRGRGRPRTPIRDVIHAGLLKVFEDRPVRSAVEGIERQYTRGLATTVMSYNTLSRELCRPEVMPFLQTLVTQTVMPLIPIVTKVAVDSTVFDSLSTDLSWAKRIEARRKKGSADERKEPKEPRTDAEKEAWNARFMKAHGLVDTNTHAILVAQPTRWKDGGDSPMFRALLPRLYQIGFRPREILGDAAYLAEENIALTERYGAVPYFDFRSNTTGMSGPHLYRLYHRFLADPVTYEAHYHMRSNVETAFSMLKERYAEYIRARVATAKYNEIMLR